MHELDGQQTGSAPVAGVNQTNHVNNSKLNTFALNHYNALTARFGDITPFLSVETVPDGQYKFGSNHELRTLTLGSPLLSPVHLKKHYYHVPKKVVMPETYEIFLRNPKHGSDIPDDAKPAFNILELYRNLAATLSDCTNVSVTTPNDTELSYTINWSYVFHKNFWLYLALARNIFSQGCLLKYLGYPIWDSDFDSKFTNFVDAFWDPHNLVKDPESDTAYIEISLDTVNRHLDLRSEMSQSGSEFTYVKPALFGFNSVCDFFNVLESYDYDDFVVSKDIKSTFATEEDAESFPLYQVVLDLHDFFAAIHLQLNSYTTQLGTDYKTNPYMVDLGRLLAYQMTCAQFFTNDNVDDIDNSKVYLQNLRAMAESMSYEPTTFVLNGVTYRYDVISVHILDSQTGFFYNDFFFGPFWLNLLCFRQSLKFGDYFNGSRLEPLAVGDVNIDVNTTLSGSYVAALDVTRNLAKQKFLNAVNKLSSNIAQYTKGIFGSATQVLDPTPQYLASSTMFLGNPETTNTADQQGKLTSEIKSVDGKYEFTAQFSDFGYLFGFVSFDVIPCYAHTMDRNLLHRDRFELYNPMLQNIGDQVVYNCELRSDTHGDQTFAYQQRYAEYKNALNVCSGAFSLVDVPERDNQFYGIANWLYIAQDVTDRLNSEFLRHNRADFDRFFTQFDGVSLAHYFHFILIFNNQLTANLPMQYQSTLL